MKTATRASEYRVGTRSERAGMRPGDPRPFEDSRRPLTVLPKMPFRGFPRHGSPYCVGEWVAQSTLRLLARRPAYVAVVVTLILLIQILGHL